MSSLRPLWIVSLSLAAAGSDLLAQDPGRRAFDPTAGIGPDGSIARPELPDDLPHPARWRYVPEGRIVPGDPLERLWVTTFVAPQVFAEPDIGVGGGLVLTDIDFRNQRRREFAGIFLSYTTEGQQRYRIAWRRFMHHLELPEGGVLQEERSFWQASAGYERTLTRRFFGLGADTVSGDETSYTDDVWELGLTRQETLFEMAGDWIGSLGIAGEYHDLAGGRVSDVPTTGAVFPSLVDAGDEQGFLWLSAGLEWNTRDSQHSPYAGTTVGASARFAPLQSSGDAGAIVGIEVTQVVPVPSPFHNGGSPGEENPPTDTIAFAFATGATIGELPFYALPSLGGSRTLRGYINGRFTDRAYWHGSAEYRFWFSPRGFPITDRIRVERVGAALFYDVGSVAHAFDDLSTATVRDSFGIGLRFHLERLALFRVDVGFSDEDRNLTISYGLPF
ncbi:MAG: BamA/TamA family outer membrane protein [Planctomycetes bacterium]|nr:BamA/TamA family outer membrane protein [Planctomycetota bacterium]